jgi:hypothetical protein
MALCASSCMPEPVEAEIARLVATGGYLDPSEEAAPAMCLNVVQLDVCLVGPESVVVAPAVGSAG